MTSPHPVYPDGRVEGEVQSAPDPWRKWLPLLIALAAVLAIAALVVTAMARQSISAQDRQIADLRAEQVVVSAQKVGNPRPELDAAALSKQLTTVQTADREVDAAVQTWRLGKDELKIVWAAVGRCMYEVDQYDQSAAWYSAEELGKLPVSIDLSAAATDCGKAVLAKNAKGAGF